MPEAILVFKIFISCPGDVEEEKNRLIEFFASTEAALAKKGIPAHLKPLYWKSIVHQYDGVRGQSIINNEFNNYDHYIGILASRFGTPTKTEEGIKYGSGTEEEFRLAVKTKKEKPELGLYMFFKNVTEPTEPKQKKEYKKIVKFKHELYKDGWVNHFNNPVNLSDKINQDLIPIIEDTIRKHKVVVVSRFKAEAGAKVIPTPEGSAPALATLTDEISVVEIENPITRTVTVEAEDSISLMLFSDDYKKDLAKLVTEESHIVLLGNAGSGKSTELAKLVETYQKEGALFVPIFSKLNTYHGGSIADFLPGEFQNVPENIALLVLDGLDEVETEYFNEAIQQIYSLGEKYPLLKLVVSCRTNFFELSVGGANGYLDGFLITRIDEITPSAIIQTMNENGLNGEEFYKEVQGCEYEDIITKPFFLNILSAVYQKRGNLRGGRDKIFAEAIRLKLDAAATKEELLENHLVRCEHLLTRLALVMEYVGRNYLTADELNQVIPVENDRNIIGKCSIVSLFRGNWSFEHNNIQEYFAARALSSLNLNSIKPLVSFGPDYKNIKPSWLNTLSFLVSIAPDETRQPLLDWIITNEPDTIIRFEPDRINDDIRNRVFAAIFKEFQDNELSIRSNKFTEAELGRFADTPASFELVKEAIGRTSNSVNNKITALRLLEFFSLHDGEERQRIQQLILQFIGQHEDKPEVVYSAINVLVRCKLADQQTVDNFVAKYSGQEDAYYRATLYMLITQTENVDRYYKVLLEGVQMIANRNPQPNKSSLWDETAHLKRAFEAIRDPEAVDTTLEFFAKPFDERYGFYSHKREVLQSLIKRAIVLFPEAPNLYSRVLDMYINYVKTSNREILALIGQFFEQTGTVLDAFIAVLNRSELGKFEKNHLLAFLLNSETIDFIISQAESEHVKVDEVAAIADDAYYHTRNTPFDAAALELKQKAMERINIDFDDAGIDVRREKRRQHEQESFDLLFNEEAFKAEAERFWQVIGKKRASWRDIWYFSNNTEYYLDRYFPGSVTTIIGELSRSTSYITKESTDAFMNHKVQLEFARVESIYNQLKSSDWTVSKEQLAYLEDWANRAAARIDLKKSIGEDGRFDAESLIIWYFVKHLHIKIRPDKLLDYSLFYDYIQGDIEAWYSPIVNQVGEEAFNARVIENLKSGLNVEKVWELNAEYALKKRLNESYDTIKSDLVRITEIGSVKANVAKCYLEATDDQEGLIDVLMQMKPQNSRWELVDLLAKGRSQDKIHDYLLDVLNADEEKADKIAAAQRLTAMADEQGFNYYADNGFDNPDLAYRDELWLGYLIGLKTLNFLPRLMALLEQSLLPENQKDVFRRFDSQVLEALFNMGLQSEENFKEVTAAVRHLISNRAPKLNYLLRWLSQLDFQFKLNLSSDVRLDVAIGAITALGYI